MNWEDEHFDREKMLRGKEVRVKAAWETAAAPCDSISGAAEGIHSFKQPSGDYFRHLPNLASAPPTSILASGVAPCLALSHHSAPSLSLGIKKPLFVSGPLTNAPSSSPPSIHPSVYPYVGPLICLPACLLVYLSVIQPRAPRVSSSPGSIQSCGYNSRAASTWPCAFTTRPLPLLLQTRRGPHAASAHCSRQRQGLKHLAIRAM